MAGLSKGKGRGAKDPKVTLTRDTTPPTYSRTGTVGKKGLKGAIKKLPAF